MRLEGRLTRGWRCGSGSRPGFDLQGRRDFKQFGSVLGSGDKVAVGWNRVGPAFMMFCRVWSTHLSFPGFGDLTMLYLYGLDDCCQQSYQRILLVWLGFQVFGVSARFDITVWLVRRLSSL